MKNSKAKSRVHLHGELTITHVASLPEGNGRELKPSSGYVILAESETTGNHHVVDAGCRVLEYPSGARYLDAERGAKVRCTVAERHDTLELPPGVYEVGIQQEYDYIADAKRAVQD